MQGSIAIAILYIILLGTVIVVFPKLLTKIEKWEEYVKKLEKK